MGQEDADTDADDDADSEVKTFFEKKLSFFTKCQLSHGGDWWQEMLDIG